MANLRSCGALLQVIFLGGIAVYFIIGGAFLIEGLKLAVSSSCCLPPVKTCGDVKTDFRHNIYGSDAFPGLCDISFVDGKTAIETAVTLNCPAAANLTQCDQGLSNDGLCNAHGGRGVILANAVIAIVLGSIVVIYLIVAVLASMPLDELPGIITMTAVAALVLTLCITAPITVHRVFSTSSFTQEAVVCDLYVSDICVSYTKSEFKKSEKIGNTCPWEGQTAQVFDIITNIEDMRRPSIALLVMPYLILLVLMLWGFFMCIPDTRDSAIGACGLFAGSRE